MTVSLLRSFSAPTTNTNFFKWDRHPIKQIKSLPINSLLPSLEFSSHRNYRVSVKELGFQDKIAEVGHARFELQQVLRNFQEIWPFPWVSGMDGNLFKLSRFIPRHPDCKFELEKAWKKFFLTPVGQQIVEIGFLGFTKSSFDAFLKELPQTSSSKVSFNNLYVDNLSYQNTLSLLGKIKTFNKFNFDEIGANEEDKSWDFYNMEIWMEWVVKTLKELNGNQFNRILYLLGSEASVSLLSTTITTSPATFKRLVYYWQQVLQNPLSKREVRLESVLFSQNSFQAFLEALKKVPEIGSLNMIDCHVDQLSPSSVHLLMLGSLKDYDIKNIKFKNLN